MLRRHVLALGGIAAVGAPIIGELLNIGELLDLSGPAPAQCPSRLFGVHVAQVRDLTGSLRGAIHTHGANPQVSSAGVHSRVSSGVTWLRVWGARGCR